MKNEKVKSCNNCIHYEVCNFRIDIDNSKINCRSEFLPTSILYQIYELVGEICKKYIENDNA